MKSNYTYIFISITYRLAMMTDNCNQIIIYANCIDANLSRMNSIISVLFCEIAINVVRPSKCARVDIQ